MISSSTFTVNGRRFTPPARPLAVICLDGSADEYLDAAMSRGLMPNLLKLSLNGWRGLARAAMPTFTNVNNTCIVTGVPPSVHGIGGNFFLNPENGEEVMMNSAQFLRAETIFPHAQRAGRKVAVVTAKEKLRDIFASGLIAEGGIAFSAEKASAALTATHGIDDVESLVGPTPAIYSGDASVYVLKAGVALLKAGRADFLYLSTTDYIQHKYEPAAEGALEFYAAIDAEIGRLLAAGAVVGVTADHGMNAKQLANGRPNVIFLETELTQRFGGGIRVILPITDPYVAHHGALGSFAQVHLPAGLDVAAVKEWLLQRSGITEVHERATGARLMELPADRMGDLAVASGRDTVLGRTLQWHDLRAVTNGLRSHGGRYEEIVPFLLSEPVNPNYAARASGDLRNFDIFEFTCNGGPGGR
ncbi:phosphonoacetate hydrolase [Oleiharenicola lentus]|uniref:phosphonoacetate hydrolase n=1 Tax=Oleiharenicola lentus TaxID=2508720 RepID=UPI003F66ECD2